ncbi:hypothetical protein CL633_00485 [bacterium]|nr:hypothetical protein [bacterium]|tara:strand:- start:11698 stop:11883 length:186 start_codon:yes stop_codon:yes gene_type:complete
MTNKQNNKAYAATISGSSSYADELNKNHLREQDVDRSKDSFDLFKDRYPIKKMNVSKIFYA